jgi:hypothetical protein
LVLAWINRNRRLAKDVEATLKSAAAFHCCLCRHDHDSQIGSISLSFETNS